MHLKKVCLERRGSAWCLVSDPLLRWIGVAWTGFRNVTSNPYEAKQRTGAFSACLTTRLPSTCWHCMSCFQERENCVTCTSLATCQIDPGSKKPWSVTMLWQTNASSNQDRSGKSQFFEERSERDVEAADLILSEVGWFDHLAFRMICFF